MGEKEVEGRFPSNVILNYDDDTFHEVCGNMPETSSNGGKTTMSGFSKYNGSMMNTSNLKAESARKESDYIAPKDAGNACRYYYCAKASRKDRDEGLLGFETKQCVGGGGGIGDYLNDVNSASGKFGSEKAPHKNFHPCVKPTNLMQYLVRLVAPAGAVILDPFNGSGSTGKAVMFENTERNKGYKYIGIELTEEYLPIAKARIDFGKRPLPDEEAEYYKDGEKQMNIFDFISE